MIDMEQNNYMQQMMNENTNVLKDETTVHDDSWRFDDVQGKMVSVVSVTTSKVVELTPLAVKQIVQSWNQAVRQGDSFRRMYDLIGGSSLKPNKQESEVLAQWKQVLDNADKAEHYLELNQPHIAAMEEWVKVQADKEKDDIATKIDMDKTATAQDTQKD